MLAILVAGPAISRTRAAPGVIPFSTRASASGMEPVAQVYMGMASTRTTIMQSNGYSCRKRKKSSGTNAAMSAPSRSPARFGCSGIWFSRKMVETMVAVLPTISLRKATGCVEEKSLICSER